jgi:hypothetical protein
MKLTRQDVRGMISRSNGHFISATLTRNDGKVKIFGVRFGLNIMGFGVAYNPDKFWFRVMNLNKL